MRLGNVVVLKIISGDFFFSVNVILLFFVVVLVVFLIYGGGIFNCDGVRRGFVGSCLSFID